MSSQSEPNSESPEDADQPTNPPQPPTEPVVRSATPTSSTAGERFQQSVAEKRQNSIDDEDEEEEVLWSGGYSPKAMVGTWILMAVVSIVVLIAPFLSSSINVPFPVVLGVVVVIWLIGGLSYAYKRLGYHYELTTQRFIHQTGLLSRQTDRIEVIDIDDVSFTQGPVQRIFGVGTIKLTGSDRTHPELVMLGIAKVRDISGTIDDTRRRERRRRSLHIESI